MSLVKVNSIIHPSGTANNITLDSSGNITFANTVAVPSGNVYPIVTGTSQATTSGTAIDFTSIPSWAKRITILFNGVSTATATGYGYLQVGAGSIVSSGYINTMVTTAPTASVAGNIFTAAFGIWNFAAASDFVNGSIVLTSFGSNTWIASGALTQGGSIGRGILTAGNITLSGALDRIRISSSTSETFDAGSINIMYE